MERESKETVTLKGETYNLTFTVGGEGCLLREKSSHKDTYIEDAEELSLLLDVYFKENNSE